MSTINDRMIGEYEGYNMYANDFGMYYFYQLTEEGTFAKRIFDDIDVMKNFIDITTVGRFTCPVDPQEALNCEACQ